MSSRARAASVEFRARAPFVRSMTSSKTIRQDRIFSECANEVAAVLKCLVLGEEGSYGGLEEREKFGLWRPYRILSTRLALLLHGDKVDDLRFRLHLLNDLADL